MARLDIELRVVGAEMLRHGLGVRRLVVALLVEADRERAHRSVALRLHQRHDGRGVDAAGQEGAERHVGDHAAPDGVAQQRVERSTASRSSGAECHLASPSSATRRASQNAAISGALPGASVRIVPGGSLRISR